MLAYAHKTVRSPGKESCPSFRMAVLPVEQQALFPTIYMLTSPFSIPYQFECHKTLQEQIKKKKSVVQLKCGELLVGDTGVNKAGQSLNAESQLLPL